MTSSRLPKLLAFSVVPLVLSLLAPNHYFPWLAAWNDGLAALSAVLLLGLAARSRQPLRLPTSLTAFVLILVVSVLLQWVTGRLLFGGDAWMVLLYTGVWLAAFLAGQALTHGTGSESASVVLPLALLTAGVLSVGLALNQWTGTLQLGIYMADLPKGGRPFANLAQPNNFCTLSFLALCSLLVLYQLRRVGALTLWLGSSLLLWGMVLSQSRTGWLQIAALLLWVWVMQSKAQLRVTRAQATGLSGLYVVMVVLLPLVSQWLLLGGSRSLDDQMHGGLRWPYWRMMVDAISQQPWTGYGWTQVGAAQQAVALRHAPLGDFFEHAHNFGLDVLLWVGVPLGVILLGCLAGWAVQNVRRCRTPNAAWWLLGITGQVMHGMLELPLEYAYFLVPLGLMMGAVHAEAAPDTRGLTIFPRYVWGLAGVLAVMLTLTGRDYLVAEENYRTLRLESARIGTAVLVTPAPDLLVLTQLEAFLQFARIEATPDLTTEQVNWMRKVATRFGYPPVLFRYALATGLHGQPEEALQTLQRLCQMHGDQRCDEARTGWVSLQQRYPNLPAMKHAISQ